MASKVSSTAGQHVASARVIAGRYRVERELGRGGVAHVFRVRDAAHGGSCALKLLGARASSRVRELFELEYQVLASLRHPRLVEVFELGRDGDELFYTMELLEGEDLSARVPLPWRTTCAHLRDACQGLGLLHARRLVHRDISPRNLWRTPDGRVKLLDFGALAPFGPSEIVIGTPPLVPPEALNRLALTERSDLYSLGALAYYLLTGGHAFPAHDVRQLQQLWTQTPLPPSLQLPTAETDPDPIPPELDRLVLALLHPEDLARPSSTAEVIDRIDTLLGTSSETEPESAESRLRNVGFVGRTRERRRLSRQLALARGGRGQVCTIEAAAGVGRSRMLQELAVWARLGRLTVVAADANSERKLFGVAETLSLGLLASLPELAQAAAQPYAALLGHVSPLLRERLGPAASPLAEPGHELHARIQAALCDWFMAVARQKPLALLIDGLEHADEASTAFVLALALRCPRQPLLLAVAVLHARTQEHGSALRTLLKTARRLPLERLREPELHALLASVFGSAEHLPRLSWHLFRSTRGNPGHALELCRLLVRRGEITLAGGTWLLPRDVDPNMLFASRAQVMAARLGRVGADARELAALLSIHEGPLSPTLCRVLATSTGRDLMPQLQALLAEEILVASGANLVFASESLSRECARGLGSEAVRRARRALGEHLLQAADSGPIERIHAGLHLLGAGEERGGAVLVESCLTLVLSDVDKLAAVAPALESALKLFRAQGRTRCEQLVLLGSLAIAGYQADYRYCAKYGREALRSFAEVLGLDQARRLQRRFGGKLGLVLALAAAAVRFRRLRSNPLVPSFRAAMQLLFTTTVSLAGARIMYFEADAAAEYADVLAPFAALGPKHVAAFVYDFCHLLALTVRDRFGVARQRWLELLARLDGPDAIEGMTETLRQRCRAGALSSIGVIEAHRDDTQALARAERLERDRSVVAHRMMASQIRLAYYGYHGQLAAYERERERAEQCAIQLGTTWQMAAWILGPWSAIAHRTHDVMAMKLVSGQMTRQKRAIPALEPHAQHFRGNHLLLRGRTREALPFLEYCLSEPPGRRVGWARSHGVLAEAYNRLGEYERARAACARVFEHYDPSDFEFPAMNMVVQTQAAVAEAGLGRPELARRTLDELFRIHGAHANLLTLGQLREAAVEVALIAGDHAEARRQLGLMSDAYRGSGCPSLVQFCEAFAARVEELAQAAQSGVAVRRTLPADAPATSSIRSSTDATAPDLLAHTRQPLEERAQAALELLAAHTNASMGALYLIDAAGRPLMAAKLGELPASPAIEHWATQRLAYELAMDEAQTQHEAEPTAGASLVQDDVEHGYRLLLLARSDAPGSLVGVVALGAESGVPLSCPSATLRSIACQLYRAMNSNDNAVSELRSRWS